MGEEEQENSERVTSGKPGQGVRGFKGSVNREINTLEVDQNKNEAKSPLSRGYQNRNVKRESR